MIKKFRTNQNLIDSGFRQSSGDTLTLNGMIILNPSASLKYHSDMSHTYTARSVVDAEFVTGNSNIIKVFIVTGVTYSATTSSNFIGTSGGTTIWLPSTPKNGQEITVVDVGGNSLNNNISICSNIYNIIDDDHSLINTNHGSTSFVFNGTFWSATAFIN